jgi:hypothetical protein
MQKSVESVTEEATVGVRRHLYFERAKKMVLYQLLEHWEQVKAVVKAEGWPVLDNQRK